jgi:hypothetical protein
MDRAIEVALVEWNVVEVTAGSGRQLQVRFADGTSGAVHFLAPDAMYDEIKRHGVWVLR